MNVRFFAGTRAQYDSLPAPRNPLGLYFCADTQELFWADRLLTDGMRVVEKQSDLPAPEQAADGVVYYVNETRNGYVVPHGTNKWLQTIYAPIRKGESVVPGEEDNTVTTVGAVNDIVAQIYKDMEDRIANIEIGTSGSGVKVIEFAGYELEEVGDGNFTIDRRCARKALGLIVPEGLEDEDITIASKDYVDKQIAAVTGTDLSDFVKQEDLEDYATKEHVQSLIAEAELNNKPDLSNYYTKPETDIAIKSAVNAIIVPNVATLATKEELQNAINNIEHPPVPTKVSELENDAGYVTADQLFEKSREVYSISVSGLASGAYVTPEESKALDMLFDLDDDYPWHPAAAAYINDVLVVKVNTFTPGRNLVLETAPSAYYTSEGTYLGHYKYTFTKGGINKNPDIWHIDNYLQIKSSVLATEQFVKDSIDALNLPEADLSNYYNKSETETLVNEAINGIDIPDTSSFITMDDVEAKGYLTEHQDLSEYAKKSELPSVEGLASEDFVRSEIAKAELNGGEVTEEELDNLLANYYNKTEVDNKFKELEIPSIEGLATEEFVNNAIAGIESPEAEIYKVDFNAPNYTEAVEAYNNGKVLVLINAAPDVNSYAVMNYVRDDIISFTKFLMSRSGTYGSFNTYYLHNDDTWELAKEVKLNKVEITNDGDLQVGKQTLEIPSVDGFATEEYVDNKIGEIRLPEAELFIVDFAAPDFTAAINAYNNGKFLVLANAAPDANGYAVMNYVRSDMITFTKFLTSRSEAYGSFNTYYLSPANTWEISKEVRLNKVEANVEGEVNGELTSIRIGKEIYKLPTVDLTGYATKDELAAIEAKIPTDYLKEIPSEYITETRLNEVLADIEHPSVDLSGYATTESVEALAADIEHDRAQLESIARVIESTRTEVATLSATTVTQKYEVLPIEGMFVQYNDNEVRVNTQHVDIASLPKQEAGDGSSDSYYYVTFRAYAPEGATSVIEGSGDKMDAEHSTLATDNYGRKYTTIWAAIANKSGDTWSKFGDKSTIDKYLGFYYNFHWYTDDKLLSKEKVRVILTNDSCHNDLVPDAVARRIDDKVALVNTTINNITEQVQNIEENYVTNEVLENYATTEELEANYITTTEATTKIERIVEEIVQEVTTPGSLNYDTF